MLLLFLNFLDSDIQTTTDSLTHWGKTIMIIKPHDYCRKKNQQQLIFVIIHISLFLKDGA